MKKKRRCFFRRFLNPFHPVSIPRQGTTLDRLQLDQIALAFAYLSLKFKWDCATSHVQNTVPFDPTQFCESHRDSFPSIAWPFQYLHTTTDCSARRIKSSTVEFINPKRGFLSKHAASRTKSIVSPWLKRKITKRLRRLGNWLFPYSLVNGEESDYFK